MRLVEFDNGVVYFIEDTFEGLDQPVNVSIEYSGGESDTLEFEWATASKESNPWFTEEQLQSVNKTLECGLEERYVNELEAFYANTNIKFEPNHYQSVLK